MPYPFDQWHDWLRSVNVMMSATCCIEMLRYRHRHRKTWGKAERDDWFVWFAVSTSLMFLSVDGLIEDLPFSLRPVFSFVLCCILVRGIYSKRKWMDD